jgi:hypothetical protein
LLYLLGAALNYLLSLVITIPAVIITALIPGANSPQHAQSVAMIMLFVVYGAMFAIQAFTRPVFGIALMLFYYDQRIRHEGFDIEWMMQRAGLAVPVSPPSETVTWLPADARRMEASGAGVPVLEMQVDSNFAPEAAPEAGFTEAPPHPGEPL